jgi:hypothetical protein
MTALTLASGQRSETKDTGDAHGTVKYRVQLDLPPRSMDRLNALKRKTEAASYAEVVKNALQIYEALIAETEDGKQFLTRDKDGVMTPIRLFL